MLCMYTYTSISACPRNINDILASQLSGRTHSQNADIMASFITMPKTYKSTFMLFV